MRLTSAWSVASNMGGGHRSSEGLCTYVPTTDSCETWHTLTLHTSFHHVQDSNTENTGKYRGVTVQDRSIKRDVNIAKSETLSRVPFYM